MGRDRGRAVIYVDGVMVDTVDLFASATTNQRIVWARNWDTSGAHTVMIYVVGTAGRPAVDIDAFLTAQ
jgi:hypothetical protein